MLNCLFITSQGAYLSKEREAVLIHLDGEEKKKLPLSTFSGIVCFGRVNLSPPLMHHCTEKGISVTFLSIYGRFLARVQGPVSGNVLLRKEQYRRSDNEKHSLDLAKSFVLGKIKSSRAVIRRNRSDHHNKTNNEKLKNTQEQLKRSLGKAAKAKTLDSLRGTEGEVAKAYFEVFNHFITQQKEDFQFIKRSRRPPLDKVNALLSFLYTLLMHDVRSALEVVGLDPAVGYLHRDRPGRMGLALDMMEEFRAFLVDRLVLSLINRKQVYPDGFIIRKNGAVSMNDETRKVVINAYQERKQDQLKHPFLEEKIPIGMFPMAQAMLLSRHLRGDLDAYPPYFWS